jgi:hypothetical protein
LIEANVACNQAEFERLLRIGGVAHCSLFGVTLRNQNTGECSTNERETKQL